MDFSLNKKKVLWILGAGVLAFVFRSVVFQYVFMSCIGECHFVGEVGDGLQGFAITVVLVYLLWSLLENKG